MTNSTLHKAALPLAFAVAFGLGACSQNASDQPENATADAPSTATPSDTTADISSPSANDSANATATGSPTDPYATTDMGTTGDSALGDTASGVSGSDTSAMGGTSTGSNVYNANLQEELQRCDQLSGAERDTCRTDAQNRYEQSGTPTQP